MRTKGLFWYGNTVHFVQIAELFFTQQTTLVKIYFIDFNGANKITRKVDSVTSFIFQS